MPSAALASHRDFLFKFTANHLEAYTEDLRLRGPSDQKEFNDPIWQTIVMLPFEVAILDSPLLQRLRLIRQLGVVHWVYPGATHTRFEHTLGVIHQVHSLILSINKRSKPDHVFISQRMTNLMRLIALCHDIGHGVMSHVSENALRSFSEMDDLLRDFKDEVRAEKAKPSEMAAYYMVGSPAFKRLLEVAMEKYRDHQLPENVVASIQDAIVGKKISDEIPLLHELINGPFDADKLDYMPRDARMAGVPVVTDIPRLIQKVRASYISQENLPERAAANVPGGFLQYTLVGIALSGGRTLDELMLGRALLFDKIYRHQKVRAAESMVAALLQSTAISRGLSPTTLPFAFVDDQLINLEVTKEELEGPGAGAARVALDIAKRLRERRLFVRAFAFSQYMPFDPYAADERQRAGIEKLIRNAGKPLRRGELIRGIAAETRTILFLLEKQELLEKFSDAAIGYYIWIDPPEAPSQASDVNDALLITPEDRILPFGEETAEARAWSDAYPLARDLGYVFTAPELSPYVFLATEKEVRVAFGIRIPESTVTYAKQPRGLINDLRRELARKGYYEEAPFDLQPIPARLSNAAVENKLRDLAGRLVGYSGPYREDAEGRRNREGRAIGWERIVDWLRQFEEEEVINDALQAVEKVRLIGRDDIVRSIQKFMASNPAFREAFICPLGGPKDSSSVCVYEAGDIEEEYGFTISPLADALAFKDARPILFVEDFVGSGGQAVTILETLLGEKPSRDLGEARQPLSTPLRNVLRERQLGFLFAAGMDEGIEHLQRRARELSLSATVDVAIRERDLPVAFPEGQVSSARERFRSRCMYVGKALLSSCSPRHTPEWIDARALGYGNRGFLVLFPYNTPAQTLTCLWAEGKVGNRHWSALFPRRKKS